MVPPRGLYHPVLPMRYAGKLMFALCRTCMHDHLSDIESAKLDDKSDDCVCEHKSGDRSFQGTWCTPELYRALDNGYVITAVREVHDFPRFRKGLFEEYVNTFLKAKQEASGWPQVKKHDLLCKLNQSIMLSSLSGTWRYGHVFLPSSSISFRFLGGSGAECNIFDRLVLFLARYLMVASITDPKIE